MVMKWTVLQDMSIPYYLCVLFWLDYKPNWFFATPSPLQFENFDIHVFFGSFFKISTRLFKYRESGKNSHFPRSISMRHFLWHTPNATRLYIPFVFQQTRPINQNSEWQKVVIRSLFLSLSLSHYLILNVFDLIVLYFLICFHMFFFEKKIIGTFFVIVFDRPIMETQTFYIFIHIYIIIYVAQWEGLAEWQLTSNSNIQWPTNEGICREKKT